MVQWFEPVLLLAALLVTAESSTRRNKYEVSVRHGPFEIHQRHVNAKPFKEPSRDKPGTIGQNNPHIGYRREVSLSEEIYEPRKKGRKRGERWNSQGAKVEMMKVETPRQKIKSDRGMTRTKQIGSWSYTTTFEPTTEATTKIPVKRKPFPSFGERSPGSVRKPTTTQQAPQEDKWLSSTPAYQNFVTTQQSNDPNVHQQGFAAEKSPPQPITFYNTQSASYGNIRTQGANQNNEDNNFQRTTSAPEQNHKLTIVNPVTPSVLFRNPQLRVPFTFDSIDSVSFDASPKQHTTSSTTTATTTTTTAAPTTTTTTTTTPAPPPPPPPPPPSRTSVPNFRPTIKLPEDDNENVLYLLVKYEKPRNGGQARAQVLEILGGNTNMLQSTESNRLKNDFDLYPKMEETVRESLKNVNLNNVEVTTAGYAVEESLESNERNQLATPLALIGPPMRGSNQPSQNNLPAEYPTQQDPLAQKYFQHQQRFNALQQNSQPTATQSSPQINQNLQQAAQIHTPIAMSPQAFQTNFILPTTYWGLPMQQMQQQPQPMSYMHHSAFHIQHLTGPQQFNQIESNTQQSNQIKLEDQGDLRVQLDRSSKTPVQEPNGNAIQQESGSGSSEASGESGLRNSYGQYFSDSYKDYEKAEGARRPDVQAAEPMESSKETLNETTDPLELSRILVSQNGGLTVEQFNQLFKDYLDKELTESDLDSYERVVDVASGSGRSSQGGQTITATTESGESFEQQQQQQQQLQQEQEQQDDSGEISGSSEGDDRIRVQINKTGGRQEPIVKIGYGSSKSHQGVYKSPKFFEKLKESGEEEQTEQWDATGPLQGLAPSGFEAGPVFGYPASTEQQQGSSNQKLEESQRQQEQQENSVSDEPTNGGHHGGLSYIKFEKFN